ncbi:hypothetical protein N8000_05360 [Rhodospirillales bacterium]|nr:hypothetical protein [Rhodospirillales bacterium]
MPNDLEKNLPVSRPNKDIEAVGRQLATVNKALTTINHEKFIEFLARNKNAAEFFVDTISHYYPLEPQIIAEHSNVLNWSHLSGNKSLLWSEELVAQFADKWDWWKLCGNAFVQWNKNLILKFEDKIEWFQLRHLFDYPFDKSQLIQWDADLFSRFLEWTKLPYEEMLPIWKKYSFRTKEKLHDENRLIISNLPNHTNVLWSEELIALYEQLQERDAAYINWSRISSNKRIPWTIELIDRFRNRWDWEALASNESLPWSEELLRRFKGTRGLSKLLHNETVPWQLRALILEQDDARYYWDVISGTGGKLWSKFAWNEELIAQFEDKWHWKTLSRNTSLPWSEGLIERFQDKWDWSGLSQWGTTEILDWDVPGAIAERKKSLTWNEELIARFADKWDWDVLSNGHLTWTDKLIARYEAKWNWDRLSAIHSLPWSDELIAKYCDRWDWNTLSGNQSLPWNEYLIARYADKWDWDELSQNRGLPWSDAFVIRFENEWKWNRPPSYIKYLNDVPLYQTIFKSKELFQRYFDTLVHKLNGWEIYQFGYWSKNQIEDFWLENSDYIKAGEAERDEWHLLAKNENHHIDEDLVSFLIDKSVGSLEASEFEFAYFSSMLTAPWSAEFIRKFEDKWNWEKLSANPSLPWSIELIEQFEDKWDWTQMSIHFAKAWDQEIILKFRDEWDVEELFKCCLEISCNFGEDEISTVALSETVIDSFQDELDFSKLSELDTEIVPWNAQLLARFKSLWDWDRLSSNESLPLDENLIERFSENWNWVHLFYRGGYRDPPVLFRNWNSSEVSHALKAIKEAHGNLNEAIG